MDENCKNCGAKIKPDAGFCQECGSKIERETITCKSCGAELKKGMKFCTVCGEPTEEIINNCPGCGRKLDPGEDYCSECGTNANDTKTESFLRKNRNVLLVAVVAVVLLIAVSLVAMTGTTPEAEPQNVEVGSTNFIIPGDYQIDPSSIDVDYKYRSATFAKAWVNSDGDVIYIATMTVPYGVDVESVLSSEGGSHKSMIGYDGYYTEEDGFYNFAFETGGYVCVVTVSDPQAFDEIRCLG